MAYIKLLPPTDGEAMPVIEVIRRLRDEFGVVELDPDAGQDYVAEMIAATHRWSHAVPGKQEQLEHLKKSQQAAVLVAFGDDHGTVAQCLLMPGWDLLFDKREELEGPARPLLTRAAVALGYRLSDS
jgi:hypothetical protein